jgi:uncharacterized 2Fe-2S/4Fe-4S cluster protein (DUF4445 family)
VSAASAAVSCYSATVVEVSLIPFFENETTSKYAVRMFCEDVNDVWTGTGNTQYLLTSDIGSAGYAMILTAMASGKKVRFIAGGQTVNSLVTKLQVAN